jgi:hypothetical protein
MTMTTEMTEAERDELAQLEQEIAAAKAATAQTEAAREPTPLEAKRAELAAAKREAADALVISDLVKKYGKLGEKIASVGTPDGMLVVQAPNRQSYKEMSDATKPGIGVPFDFQEAFIKRCLVYPDKDAATKILHANPGVMGPLANLAAELGGFRQVSLSGK